MLNHFNTGGMMMRCALWVASLALLVLTTAGCERQETPQPPAPVVAEPKAPASGEEQLPLTGKELVAPDTAAPAPAPAEEVKPPAAAPAQPAPVKPAPVPTVTPAPLPAPPAVDSRPAAKPSEPAAPRTVIYEGSFGKVTFNHQQHAQNNNCGSCHSAEPATKIPLGKDKAHQLCKGCHQQQGAGPTQCNGCHLKG
jgi:predicted CXXCH cytochrome family protein